MDEKEIFKNIKKICKNKKIAFHQLAKLTGLIKGYVSKIENSDKPPPLSTLSKIADTLDTDMSLLHDDQSEAPGTRGLCIVKKSERKEVVSMGMLSGYHYEALAHKKTGKNTEPCAVSPAFHEKAVFSHEDEQFMYD